MRPTDAILLIYLALAVVVGLILAAAGVATAIDARYGRRPFSAWAASFLLLGEAAYTSGFAAGEVMIGLGALVCGLLTVAPAVFILDRRPLAKHVVLLGHLAALVPAGGVAMKMDDGLAFFYLLPLAAVIGAGALFTRSFLKE